MNQLASSALTVGLMLIGAQAFAGDMQNDNLMKKPMMNDCMSKMAAKNDGSTKEQMTAACKAETKKHMDKDDKMTPATNP